MILGSKSHGDSWPYFTVWRLWELSELIHSSCRLNRLWSSSYRLGTDRIENNASRSSIVAWISVAAAACLPGRCLGMVTSCGSAIPPSRNHVTLLPPQRCSIRVAYRRTAVSSPRGRAYDVCDHLRKRHLNVVLAPKLLLPVSTAYSLHSWWAGSRACVTQLLPRQGCSSRAAWFFCGRAPLCVLRPAVSSHRYRHPPWGLDRRFRFSLMGGPGTRPCETTHCLQGSFQPRPLRLSHRAAATSLLLSYEVLNAVAPQWHFITQS
jgi:hypothetical protein